MKSPINLVAVLKAKPGMESKLEAVLRAAVEPTHAEPGCLRYVLQRGVEEAGSFAFVESWRSQEDLNQHFEKPYIQELFRRLPEFLAGPPQLLKFAPLSAGDSPKGQL